ncbi:MAG TPA: hypothetical protein VM557_07340 [Thermoanaerobaculia bacterium]|nr:hypothetical protein [Thermoanaerobaculia bacterium]
MSEDFQIGPPRDRRRRRRLLTKRNVGITLAVLLVAFLGISLYFESKSPSDGYGRLYRERSMATELPEPKPFEVVQETDIHERRGANPLLVEGMRRQEILGVEPGMLEKQHGVRTREEEQRILLERMGEGSLQGRQTPDMTDVRIVGGPEGVEVQRKDPN